LLFRIGIQLALSILIRYEAQTRRGPGAVQLRWVRGTAR
jgi:hypothetical protein